MTRPYVWINISKLVHVIFLEKYKRIEIGVQRIDAYIYFMICFTKCPRVRQNSVASNL